MRKEYNERTKAMNKAMMDARPRGTPELDEYRQMLADDFAAEEREAKKNRSSRSLLKDSQKKAFGVKGEFKPSKKAQSDLTAWIVEHAEFADKEITKAQRRGVAKRLSKSVISGLKAAASKIAGPAAAAGFAVSLINKHKEIKSKPKSKYGSKSLMEILK